MAPSPHGSNLIQKGFPGHRGALLGSVSSIQGREISLRLAGDLSSHDGAAYFIEGQEDPVVFSVTVIRKSGRDVSFAHAGETVTIEVPLDAGQTMPRKGQQIRQLSSRFLDLPQPREAGFPLYKVPIDLEVSLSREGTLGILAAAQFRGVPRTGGISAAKGPPFQSTVTVDKATRPRPFAQVLASLFAESGDSLFRPGEITFRNDSGLSDDGIFVPPSELKKAKNDFYEFLDAQSPLVGHALRCRTCTGAAARPLAAAAG